MTALPAAVRLPARAAREQTVTQRAPIAPVLPHHLCRELVANGLADLPVMQRRGDGAVLGTLRIDGDKLRLDNCGVLDGVTGLSVAPCWDIGIVGAVCQMPDREWPGLTFLGADRCRIPVDLSRTRHDLLRYTMNSDGESIIEFRGSLHAGFNAMLNAHLLPVLIPLVIATREGVAGLAVCDFRFASAPLRVTVQVNELVRKAVDPHLASDVEDVDLSDDEFASMFGNYLPARP